MGPMPKNGRSAYNIFNTEFCAKEKDNDTTLKITELFKAAGEKWKAMSDEEKAPYQKV